MASMTCSLAKATVVVLLSVLATGTASATESPEDAAQTAAEDGDWRVCGYLIR